MSNIPLEPNDPSGADAPLGPIRTRYQQLADEILRDLEAVAAKIPRLEQAHPFTVDFARRYQAVPLPFCVRLVSAVEQKAVLRALNKLDVVEAQDVLQYNEALKPVQDKFTELAGSVRFSRAIRKATLAADCLQVYQIGKGFGRDPGSADIAAVMDLLRRDLGPRGRRVAGEEEPAPAPVPAPAPSDVSGPRS